MLNEHLSYNKKLDLKSIGRYNGEVKQYKYFRKDNITYNELKPYLSDRSVKANKYVVLYPNSPAVQSYIAYYSTNQFDEFIRGGELHDGSVDSYLNDWGHNCYNCADYLEPTEEDKKKYEVVYVHRSYIFDNTTGQELPYYDTKTFYEFMEIQREENLKKQREIRAQQPKETAQRKTTIPLYPYDETTIKTIGSRYEGFIINRAIPMIILSIILSFFINNGEACWLFTIPYLAHGIWKEISYYLMKR